MYLNSNLVMYVCKKKKNKKFKFIWKICSSSFTYEVQHLLRRGGGGLCDTSIKYFFCMKILWKFWGGLKFHFLIDDVSEPLLRFHPSYFSSLPTEKSMEIPYSGGVVILWRPIFRLEIKDLGHSVIVKFHVYNNFVTNVGGEWKFLFFRRHKLKTLKINTNKILFLINLFCMPSIFSIRLNWFKPFTKIEYN